MPIADLGDLQLHYQDRGEGLPVVGIMGFSLDQRYWAGQIPTVTEGNRFITFDNRGVGRSSRGTTSSTDEMADDAVRLLDHLEIDEAILMGASMGGTIAQRIALDHPDRVRALVLAVTWARPIEFMRRQHALARAIVDASGNEGLIQVSLLRMFTPRFFEMGAEAIDRLVGSLVAPGAPELPTAEVLAGQLDALDKHDVLHELHKITCPTLVVGARLDMLAPCFASEEIAAAIPNAELEIFDSGHAVMIEEMEAFNNRLAEFLRPLR